MKKLLTLLFAIFCGYHGMTQVSRLSINTPRGIYIVKGDYYFDHRNYNAAITHYSKAVSQNSKDIYATLRVAEAYDKLGKAEVASVWYTKALSLNPEKETDDIVLKYITVLNKFGKYDELTRWIKIYNDRLSKKNPTDAAHTLHKDSTFLLVHNLKSINSNKSDGGAAIYNDQLIFSSDAQVNDGNNNIYTSTPNADGQYKVRVPLNDAINAVANKGPIAIAQKPGRLFFTESGVTLGDRKGLTEVFFCDVPADQTGKVDIKELQIKKFHNGIGHPAINSEGTLLFFTSKSPKGDSGFDLFRSEYDGKNWSSPHHLGHPINSPGDELYPVLYNDSILYFASNRPGGLGGFDIYKVNILAKHHHHAHAQHLSAPINSVADDFGLIFNNTGGEGYLTSNRSGGVGGNDLYKLYALHVNPMRHGQGLVENGTKPEALSIYTSAGDDIELFGKHKGSLVFDFEPHIKYTLIVEHDNYKTGLIAANSTKGELPKDKTYTFNIQKTDGGVSEQKKGSAPVQNVHINAGDLITFQLIPSRAVDAFSDHSKIRLDNREEIINQKAIIVFSYVAEGESETSPKDDSTAMADLNATSKDQFPGDENKIDTISTPEPVLARNTQPDNKALVAKTNQAVETLPKDQQKSIASEPIVTKTNDGAMELKQAAMNSIVNTEKIASKDPNSPSKNLSPVDSKSDTISSTALVLAKNVQPNNKTLNTTANPMAKTLSNDTLKNIAPSVVVKPNDGAKDLKQPIINEPLKNTEKAIAENLNAATKDQFPGVDHKTDTISSEAFVLAKNTPSEKVVDAKASQLDAQKNIAARANVTKTNEQTKELNLSNKPLKNNDPTATAEKIPIGSPDKNPVVTTIQQAGATSTKRDTLSNSLNENAVVAKNSGAGNSREVPSPDAIALENKKPLQKNQSVVKGNVAKDNIIISNAAGTASENKAKDVDPIQGNQNRSSTPNDNNPATKNNLTSELSASSPIKTDSDQATEFGNNADFKYRVQIAASELKLSGAQLKKIYSGRNEIHFFKEDGYFKYYVEETSSYPVAKKALAESGVENAFIAAYKGNVKWKLYDAIAFQKKERIKQPQPGSAGNNVDPEKSSYAATDTVSENASNSLVLVAGLTNANDVTKGSDQLLSNHDVINTEKIAAKENTPGNTSERNSSNTTTPSDNTTLGRHYQYFHSSIRLMY